MPISGESLLKELRATLKEAAKAAKTAPMQAYIYAALG